MASAAWQGRQILDLAHAHDLEQRAAVHEFSDRMPRDAAEDAAHRSYRREHHLAAAAHHLRGMMATQSSGDVKSAKQHGLRYALHLKSLGHDPFAPVPPEVKARAQSGLAGRMYSFKPHPADNFLTTYEKSEDAVDETPGQKLQKFWDEKRAGDGARELAKRASAAVAGLLLRRLSKGLAGDANPSLGAVGPAGTPSTPLARSEPLCKECGGGAHPPGQHAAAKAEGSAGEKKEICAECGEHWPCSVDRNRKSYRGEIAAKHHPSGKFVDAWPAKTKKSEGSAEAAAPLYHSGGKKTCPDCRRKLTEVVSDAPHLKCDHCGRKFKKSEKDLSDEALAKFWADKKSEPGFKYQE